MESEQSLTPKENLKKELNVKLEELFICMAIAERGESSSNSKSLLAPVDRKTFEDNGVRKEICDALFVEKASASLIVNLLKLSSGMFLTVQNQDSFSPGEEKSLVLATTVKGERPLIIAFPDQPHAGVLPPSPAYKAQNLEIEREDCLSVIKAVASLVIKQN